MKNILLMTITLLFSLNLNGQVNSCYGDEKAGMKALAPGEKERAILYFIKHEFKLETDAAFTPLIYAVSFNHAWVDEPFVPCLDFDVNPKDQQPGFEPFAMDTIIDDGAFNNQNIIIDSLVKLLENKGGQQTDSAYAQNCNSRAKGSTCITIDSVYSDYVEGCIQSYGFSQAIEPPANNDAYAFSWSGVTVEDGQPIKTGWVKWQPQLKSTVKGKSRSIRQKAGTNDPVIFRARNLLTLQDTSATLLSVVMRFQTEDDTLDYNNYWMNDTVHLESDSILFKVVFPSVYTAQQGFIYLLVHNGFVIQSLKSGVFTSVPLPVPGTPVPFSFPMVNEINFHYNMDTLGMFGADPMWGQIFMYGNPERNFIRSHDSTKLIPHIRKPSCPGSADGKIDLVVNYGTPPYLFMWSNGATTQNISGLTAGAYIVVVTDFYGMPSTASFVVHSPLPVMPTAVITHVTCKGSHDGTITMSASGGTPPYHYLWNNGSTSSVRIGLYPKSYTVTVTDSKGCSVTVSYAIMQSPGTLAINSSKTNIKCGGKCNGKITASPSGGTPPYAYLWNNGVTTATASALCAGTYTCTVTDAYNCSKTKTVTITENPPLMVSVVPSGSTATALVSGGISPYAYSWNTVPVQTNVTATGLISGHVYKVKVTDSKGCTKVITFTKPFSRLNSGYDYSIIAFPNPADDKLFIECSSQIVDIKITDITGRICLEKRFENQSLNIQNEIPVSQIKNGIYMLTVFTNEGPITCKLIIRHND